MMSSSEYYKELAKLGPRYQRLMDMAAAQVIMDRVLKQVSAERGLDRKFDSDRRTLELLEREISQLEASPD